MLYVHRSERADNLVAALGDLLLTPLDDPMASEVVGVPTRGVERWLTQRLSHRLGARPGQGDGACANVVFPFPASLVTAATAAACEVDPETDPWLPERSVWPLLGLVDEGLDDPALTPLAAHIRASSPVEDRARRFATVRHLADLYDRYAVHRPEMVRAWATAPGDPGEDPRRAWQAYLWRRLRARLGVPSPAERLDAACAALVAEPGLSALPSRLSLFGLTRLPASHLQVLEALATRRDVHLFLLHPSGALWDRVAATAPCPRPGLPRAGDPTAGLAANPLLRSWGRDAREMQLVLASHGLAEGDHRPVPTPRAPTLLGLVQDDVRADRRPPGPRSPGSADDRRPLLGEDDDSLRVHACPGRSRQVEVVRDAVLHLFRADPTLEPRDVIVMCPDIESFAPLVQAAFGAGGPAKGERVDPDDGVPRLRVRLADRSLRQTNPLLAVAAHLLELAGDRLTASQVLDLASREPVSRRFGFDEDDLSRLERWVADAGIRWGLDAPHRSPWGLQDLEANTWEAGLDRLALGVAMGDASLFAGTVPAASVAGEDVDLAGRLVELVERLREAVVDLTGPQPIARWAAALAEATERLARSGQAEAWQHDQLHRVLDDAVAESGDQTGDGATCLDLAEVRSLLGDRLQGRPTRANFRTGDLTICTLVPMRSVPHRVVCLLGLDDGTFPRQSDQDGDDLLVAEPLVGDRDPRSEDRQLLLDALLAATEHLVITYGSSDLRTNRRRPPSVPVAELLDVVDRTVRPATAGRRARDVVLVRHPLQSFDPRNFSPGTLGTDGPFSFDRVNLAGAGVRQAPTAAPGFLGSLLPPAAGSALQLGSLVRFVEHPVRAFLRDRLGLYDTDGPDRTQDHLPVELDPLERWAVGERLLGLRLEGASPERALAVERGRGLLPPGALADAPLAGVGPTVEALVAVVEGLACAGSAPGSVEVNLALPDGRVLLGTVPGVRGATIVRCVYATLGPRHRLGAWVRFLALSAARPDLRVSAVTVGRSQRRRSNRPRVEVATLPPLADDPATRAARALSALEVVVDLHDRGMREPLPLYCATSGAWAEARREGADPVQAARDRWESRPAAPPAEDRDPDHVLVLGPGIRLPDLLRTPPAADEVGDTWAEDEGTRLGRLARRAWDGLLDHEHREVR